MIEIVADAATRTIGRRRSGNGSREPDAGGFRRTVGVESVVGEGDVDGHGIAVGALRKFGEGARDLAIGRVGGQGERQHPVVEDDSQAIVGGMAGLKGLHGTLWIWGLAPDGG